jgi:hypothetical protein
MNEVSETVVGEEGRVEAMTIEQRRKRLAPPMVQLEDAESALMSTLAEQLEVVLREKLAEQAPKALVALGWHGQVFMVAHAAARQMVEQLHERLAEFREEYPEQYAGIDNALDAVTLRARQ